LRGPVPVPGFLALRLPSERGLALAAREGLWEPYGEWSGAAPEDAGRDWARCGLRLDLRLDLGLAPGGGDGARMTLDMSRAVGRDDEVDRLLLEFGYEF